MKLQTAFLVFVISSFSLLVTASPADVEVSYEETKNIETDITTDRIESATPKKKNIFHFVQKKVIGRIRGTYPLTASSTSGDTVQDNNNLTIAAVSEDNNGIDPKE